jgi:hypothetical protein
MVPAVGIDQLGEDEEVVNRFYSVYGWRRWPDPMPDVSVVGYGTTAISDHDNLDDAIDLATALADGRVPVEVIA